MSKHTEGPWKFIDGFDNDGETKNVLGGIQEVNGEHFNIARIWADGPSPLADAHLIAASPNMLEALRTAFYAISGQNRDGTYRGSAISFSDEERDQIEAAISKAEGKS